MLINVGVFLALQSNLTIYNNGIDDPLLDVVAVQMNPTHARSYVVIFWYRTPTPGNDKDSIAELRKLLSAVDAEGKEIIMIGDTNRGAGGAVPCPYHMGAACALAKLLASPCIARKL